MISVTALFLVCVFVFSFLYLTKKRIHFHFLASDASSSSCKKYDAFLSFSGADVRYGFLSHLRKALGGHGIEAFIDDQMDKGQQISKFLLEKIDQSVITIVIFSQNYAYSEWCLEELLKIVECRNSTGQTVIPVFYHVDPSHVQNLTGSYGDAMAQHRTQFDKSLVEKWGSALKATACLSGIVSSHYRDECELTKAIVEEALEILDRLCPSASDRNDGLVGIESRVEQVKSLLCGPEDLCVVGIWGEGGIGKTTLAKATFDGICLQFDGQCFLRNVREKYENTTDAVLNEVVSKLFGTSGSNMRRKRLLRKKVILVLDDVSDLDQIELIMQYKDDVGRGSRIIVTSRDRHLLEYLGAKIYAVEQLDDCKALKLFCLNAFKKKVPQEGYIELSERAVKYAQGLPLALKVLGRNLFQRSAQEWEDELEKLKGTSDKDIKQILRISYDGLSVEEQELFFDIACFFKRRRRDEVERLLDAPGSKIGLSRLAEKALISICPFNSIEMHDLIVQMAKDIICEEKTLGKRRWLWDPADIRFLLTTEMGTGAVKGIFQDMSKIGNINLSRTTFQKLYNLRYLHFSSLQLVSARLYTPQGLNYVSQRLRHLQMNSSKPGSAQLYAPQGLEYLPGGLRYIHWDRYPSKSLPILAETLVELVIFDSQLEELWDGVQNLLSLKILNMCGSKKLIKVPDLSGASNLEELCLQGCESLVEIPSSLKHLSKLAILLLGHCSRLRSLPDDICHLEALCYLDVSCCGNLHALPRNLGDLKSLEKLLAHRSGIKELPDSICNLKACTELDVGYCMNLHQLPQNLGNLQSLKVLEAGGSGMKEIPSSINELRELGKLALDGSEGAILPPLTGSFPHLWDITLTNFRMSEFPIGLCSVTSLQDLDLSGNHFESIPESIQHLLNLNSLDLDNCKELKYLPESLKSLPWLNSLHMMGSTSLDQNQIFNIMNHFMVEYTKGRRKFVAEGCYPGSEVPEKMTYKNERGSSLSFSFKLLQHIHNHELEFYACVVSDRPILLGTCGIKVKFMDKYACGDSVSCGGRSGSGLNWKTIKWQHKSAEFGREFLVKGREYEVEIQFRGEGVTKCGVSPLFDHQTVE